MNGSGENGRNFGAGIVQKYMKCKFSVNSIGQNPLKKLLKIKNSKILIKFCTILHIFRHGQTYNYEKSDMRWKC